MVKIAKVIDAILRLKDQFTATMDKATTSMTRMAKQAQRTGRQIQQTGKGIEDFGGSLTKGLTVPIIGAGTGLMKMAMSFDDAYDKIRAGTGKTGDALQSLAVDFKRVYSSVPTTMDSASNAITEINKRTGLSGKPMQDLAAQTLRLSSLTKVDLNTVIASSTRMFQDAGLKASEYGKAMDFTFKVTQSTGIGIDRLQQLMTQFGGPLRQLGFDWQTSAAMLGKFEKEGVNTELVIGSLRVALGKMAKEGIKDPAEALKVMIKQIQNAGSSGKANTLALKMFGAKAGPDMAAAIREGRMNLGGLLATLKSSPETINRAAADTADFAEKFTVLKNKVMLALEPLGYKLFDAVNKLEPTFKKIVAKIQSFASWISKLTPKQQDMAVKLVMVAAAAGPVLKVVGILSGNVGKVVKAFGDFGKTLKQTGSIMKTIFTPGNIVALVIIAIAAAIVLVIKYWPQISAFFEKLKKLFQDNRVIILALAAALSAVFGPALVKAGVQAAMSGARFAIQNGTMLATTIATKAAAAAQWLLNAAMSANPIGLIIAGVALLIAGIYMLIKHWDAICKKFPIIGQIFNAVKNVVLNVFNTIKNTVISIFNGIIGFFKKWGVTILIALTWPFTLIPYLVIKNFSKIKAFISSVGNFIMNVFSGVGHFIGNIFNGLISVVKAPVNFLISAINVLIKGLNSIHIKIPKWVPLVGGKSFGFNIPRLPKLAKGTMNWKGGPVVVHDQGGEVIDLPKGSRVYPHDKSVNMAREQGRRQGNVTINVKVEGMVIREEADIDKVAAAIAKKIKEVENNTGG